ncbi:MAG TPA: CsbD family protein [Thermoanaerobaculia bacterium]|nr:CsbD family protein [Thermoanaerobaculia bacterium]
MTIKDKGFDRTPDSNPDPITKEPGAHPIGVAGGGTGGAMAGAAVGGAVGGPVGALVGGAIGAVAGGLAGKGVAESVNPTEEDAYWQKEYKNRPYYKAGHDYNTYGPGYRYGYESATQPTYAGRSFEDAEPHLEKNWNTYRGTAKTEWRDVRDATRDSFSRVQSRTGAGMTRASEVGHDVARETGQKTDAVWDQVKGNWHQMKGSIKSKWNDLTDDDVDQMKGEREKIVGKIQERYGREKWREADIESEIRGFNRN